MILPKAHPSHLLLGWNLRLHLPEEFLLRLDAPAEVKAPEMDI